MASSLKCSLNEYNPVKNRSKFSMYSLILPVMSTLSLFVWHTIAFNTKNVHKKPFSYMLCFRFIGHWSISPYTNFCQVWSRKHFLLFVVMSWWFLVFLRFGISVFSYVYICSITFSQPLVLELWGLFKKNTSYLSVWRWSRITLNWEWRGEICPAIQGWKVQYWQL